VWEKEDMHKPGESEKRGWRAPGNLWAWRLLIRASLHHSAWTCRLGMLLQCWTSPDL
jgi:hypothetical protein